MSIEGKEKAKDVEAKAPEATPAVVTNQAPDAAGADPKAAEGRPGGRKKGRKPRPRRRERQRDTSGLVEKVVCINRVCKVVSGGKNFSFGALVVVGDGKGRVGFSVGKAREVQDAIRKGIEHAKNSMVSIPMKGATIPHQVLGVFGAAKVLLKPASEGTGVIAGATVRAVCESAGIRDILTKSLGSMTALNVVRATMAGMQSLLSEEGSNES